MVARLDGFCQTALGYKVVSVRLKFIYSEKATIFRKELYQVFNLGGGESKLVRFQAKTEHTPRKYFENRHNVESTKIGHDFSCPTIEVIKKKLSA